MTYRELADDDLRKLASDLLGEDFPEKKRIDLVKVSKEIFAHYDQERQQRDDADYAAAKARADAGDLAAATAVFDRLLATDPTAHPAHRDGRLLPRLRQAARGRQEVA